MYNDSLFNAFARSYEARNESDMSMAEYLESCRGDPMRYANAAERLLAAITDPNSRLRRARPQPWRRWALFGDVTLAQARELDTVCENAGL
jgi:predicted Ser/Thr protein kinase